jgi:hypothetical protein
VAATGGGNTPATYLDAARVLIGEGNPLA